MSGLVNYFSKRGPSRILFIVMILVSAGFYIPICGFNFNLSTDDYFFIIANPIVKDFSKSGLWSVLTSPGAHYGDIQPIAFFSLWLDHAIYGLRPLGYYITQILLHALNVIVLFFVIKSITEDEWLALLCALVLGVHPLCADTVAVISQRKTLLGNFLGMVCALCYVRWRKSRAVMCYVAAILLFILSLLSKSHWICLPLLLVIADYCVLLQSELDISP